MSQITGRELRLSRLLDQVLCYYVFATQGQCTDVEGMLNTVYQEIAKTRKLADEAGIEYPITATLWKYLKKEGLL